MLSCDGGDNDVFFESADCLSPQHELGSDKFDYEVWLNEPGSVKERRQRFLQEMGFLDTYRMRDCSGAVPSGDQVANQLVFSGGKPASEANHLFDVLKERPGDNVEKVYDFFSSDPRIRNTEAEARKEHVDFDTGTKKRQRWWKRFVNTKVRGEGGKATSRLNTGTNRSRRIKVRQNKKRCMEFSALYTGQEIRAHKGLIWTMKFSPNGQYLASGGEDGIVRIWRVISQDTSTNSNSALGSFISKVKQDISYSWKKQSSQAPIFLPNKVLQIEETPLQEFYGHSSDILDLAWFNSDILLSSSMDKTVRLWQVGCNHCLSVFPHNDYVTCIQFNPVDENYFISGSIDGKVRIWGTYEGRVVDWADVRDVITAISYQPDGKGFVVGSLTGTCRFYVASGRYYQLEAQINVQGSKKTASNKITGIQFSKDKHQRVMITSEDSKLRILDGIDVVGKYRGLSNSGSQMCGSFTSSGKHIVSVGEDGCVYVWNYSEMKNASSKHTKSERSCEYFLSKGVTVAIPWTREQRVSRCHSHRDLERFSLGNWFSIDATCRGSTTWPEEKLPIWDFPFREGEYDHQQQLNVKDPCQCHHRSLPETWGLSIVTAACDGTIKTFHNLGLPVRL
ncbi:hypothetical protein L6164_012273 [Bauhinia variegata]|uniref:Uncharacterized protein n=1 Tax=Bauhinia variegata TaxID=167791 RepID=A0ACB9P9V4_BAUVA|nr:hypothetical protein L6164_012273 [Bauhinia variegata]